MSKRELNKWKNKLKLFAVLHPDTGPWLSKYPSCFCEKYCKFKPNTPLCITSLALMYSKKLDSVELLTGYDNDRGYDFCIEWIKNV